MHKYITSSVVSNQQHYAILVFFYILFSPFWSQNTSHSKPKPDDTISVISSKGNLSI